MGRSECQPRKQATSLPKEMKTNEDTGLYHAFGKLKRHDRESCMILE